jgi:hypothetical protein
MKNKYVLKGKFSEDTFTLEIKKDKPTNCFEKIYNYFKKK